MGLTDSTWSPFQSPEVQDIRAHLTPSERARVIEDARGRGAEFGRWLAVPLGVMGGSFIVSWRLGAMLATVFVVYFAFVGFPRLRRCGKEPLNCCARRRGRAVEATRPNVCD